MCCIIVLVHTHTLTLSLHNRLSDWRARPNRRYSEYSQSGVKGEGEALRADGTSEGLISPSASRSTPPGANTIEEQWLGLVGSDTPGSAVTDSKTPYRGAVAPEGAWISIRPSVRSDGVLSNRGAWIRRHHTCNCVYDVWQGHMEPLSPPACCVASLV